MSTPIGRPKLRVGLSRKQSGSRIFTSPYISNASGSSASSSNTTPVVSSKIGSKTLAIQKRKLEFAAVEHIKQEKEEKPVGTANYEAMDLEELRKLVDQKRNSLEVQKRHEKEQVELNALIEKWKQAGNDGLKMLTKIIQPTPTVEKLLDDFKMRHDEFD